MNKLNERVFTDRDFDNRMQPKAKPGEIWSAVQNLQDMFESAKKDGDRRMKENLVSFNNRRIDSFKETGLKNVSDAELKAEYRRRFGESAEKNEKKTALRESMSDSDFDEVNEFLDEFGHAFYLRTSPAGVLAVALKGGTGYDDKESAKADIEGFLEEHGEEFDLSFSNAELVNDNDDEWVFALDADTATTEDTGYDAALKFVNRNWNDFFNGDTEFEDSLGDTDVRVEVEDDWISITRLSMRRDDVLFGGDADKFKELGPEGVAERIAAYL